MIIMIDVTFRNELGDDVCMHEIETSGGWDLHKSLTCYALVCLLKVLQVPERMQVAGHPYMVELVEHALREKQYS